MNETHRIILEEELPSEEEATVTELDDNTGGRKELILEDKRNESLKTGVWNTVVSQSVERDVDESPFMTAGTLKDFIVIGEKSNFKVKVEVDDHDVVNAPFDEIQNISTDLSRISAYEKQSDYSFHVSDYDFNNRLNLAVRPMEKFPFNIIRAEVSILNG